MEEEIQTTDIEKNIKENPGRKKKTIIILGIILIIILIISFCIIFIMNKQKASKEVDAYLSPLRIDKTKAIDSPTQKDINRMLETLELNNDNFKEN
jgi:flagellar basal body-associated protein FliL